MTSPATRGLCGRSIFDDPTLFPEAPHKTYTWCWTHGLIRGRHDCTTTKWL